MAPAETKWEIWGTLGVAVNENLLLTLAQENNSDFLKEQGC